MSPSALAGLDREQILAYHQQGWHGPFALCSPEQMAGLRERIEREVLACDPPRAANVNRLMSRHLDAAVIRELATAEPLLARLRSLLGPDLLLWNSYLWNKPPGGLEIPWHQDIDYWPIEPWLNVSAWVAIDRVTVHNSCPRIIPGSHRQALPHVPAAGMAFGTQADPSRFDASQALAIELEPGEAFLFNERLLHQSEPNRSQLRRLGCSLRYTTPFVRIDHDRPPLFPGHAALLVSGEDRFGLNRLC